MKTKKTTKQACRRERAQIEAHAVKIGQAVYRAPLRIREDALNMAVSLLIAGDLFRRNAPT